MIFFKNLMIKSLDFSKCNEECIKTYYKYPLGFLFLGDIDLASKLYDYVIKQTPNESARDFNTYYDCWLYLYTKLVGNKNYTKHYEKIMKNKTNFGGFSALPNNYPEVRASAISAICSFFEKDTVTFKEAADYLYLMYALNKNENKFYFMSNENFNLIKDFPLDNERRYIFETKKARPLLYSFLLSVIALICVYLFFNDKKYLYFANKYVNKILGNDFHNDYCGKSIIATSILYYIFGKINI